MENRQRTVLVVASGLAIAVVALTVSRLLADDNAGWFAYAPNTSATFSPGSTTAIWREAVIWLAAIAAWTGLALWLYRRSPEP